MIRQRLVSNFQFSQSALVIEVSIIKMLCPRKVCLAGIWTDAECLLNGGLCGCQPRRSAANVEEVELLMSQGEREIGVEKRRIARHSLVQQIDSLLSRSSAGSTECWC